MRKKSTSKVNKIKKKICSGKSSKGKSLNKDEVNLIVGNKVPKNPPKKRKKKVYGPATGQSPRKRVKQNEHGSDESTDEENILDYSTDDDLESSDENEAELGKLELERELWKEKVKFIFICNNCSVINDKHAMARIVSERQWVIFLYSRKVVSSGS